MNEYIIYIRLPKYEDFKGVVFPNFNKEFYTKDGSAHVFDDGLMGVMFESEQPVTHESITNMWLKFDTVFIIYPKEEVDKRIVDDTYEPKPLAIIKGHANQDVIDAEAKDVQQEGS